MKQKYNMIIKINNNKNEEEIITSVNVDLLEIKRKTKKRLKVRNCGKRLKCVQFKC